MSAHKSCLRCRHLYWRNETPAYSEVTGGTPFGIMCAKNVWEFDGYTTSAKEFDEIINTAKTCKFYGEEK